MFKKLAAVSVLSIAGLTSASACAEIYPFYIFPPVQCQDLDKSADKNVLPAAWAITLEVDDTYKVEYKIDNQFSLPTGVPNLPQFYGSPDNGTIYDGVVEAKVRQICEEDHGGKCIIVRTQKLAPGERSDGVNRRPDGLKYE